jgi:hypothetical protein
MIELVLDADVAEYALQLKVKSSRVFAVFTRPLLASRRCLPALLFKAFGLATLD